MLPVDIAGMVGSRKTGEERQIYKKIVALICKFERTGHVGLTTEELKQMIAKKLTRVKEDKND